MTRAQVAFATFFSSMVIVAIGFFLWSSNQPKTVASVPVAAGKVYLLTPAGPAPSPLSDYVGEHADKGRTSAWTDSKGTRYSTPAAVIFISSTPSKGK